jgi:SET domain-containing protein
MKKTYYVAPSKIHGKGVFADQYFVTGDYIGKCLKPVLKKEIRKDKEYGYSDVSEQLGTLVEKTELEKYLNHSAKPNAEMFFERELLLSLRAKKDIAQGEEIVVEYGDAFEKIDQLQRDLVAKIK